MFIVMTMDKKQAVVMSDLIREILSNPDIMKAIVDGTGQKPPYWDMLPQKDGLTAIVIAQMLKAMSGDTAAFTALSKYGFGEKVHIDTSDFYNSRSIEINVVEPKLLSTIDNEEDEPLEIVEAEEIKEENGESKPESR